LKSNQLDYAGCGCFFLVLLASLIALVVAAANYDIQESQKRWEKKKELTLNPVKILAVDYARHGTKPAMYVTDMVVTCETKEGKRFNIIQNCQPELIPLVGEIWEIDLSKEGYYFLVKHYLNH